MMCVRSIQTAFAATPPARALVLGAGALVLGACAVGPDYTQPELPAPASYQAFAGIPADDDLWWRGFEDPALNDLVETALDQNIGLEIAATRLAEAEALARAEWSDFFPVVDGFAEGQATFGLSGGAASQEDGAGGLAMSFLPDIFGRQRRSLEAARAVALAEGFSLADARRLTAAAVAQQYIELRRAEARLELLDVSLDLQTQTIDIVEARREAGLSADLDVRRAAADLARTRAQRGTLAITRAQADYALAILLGRPPAGDVAPPADETPIPVYERGPQTGVPADLVRNRPDLRAAEADLMAATAAIGVEKADLYPTLSLPGQITADFGGADGFVDEVTALIAASLDVPLFDAGRRRAEVRAAEARARGALLTYEQALLESLGEVENALVAINSTADRRADLAQAVEASEEAFNQLNALYREGLATFIDILDAQRTLIASREAYVDSEAELASATISLYRALGAPTYDLYADASQ